MKHDNFFKTIILIESVNSFRKLFALVFCSLISLTTTAQELEPRAINNLPVGTNFAIAAYSYAEGNLLLDPALPIEDLNSNIHSGLLAYVRSIRFFDLSAKVDVVIPYILGDWQGSIDDGQNGFRTQNGFGDVRLRFSFNFLGSKAMDISEFQSSISGTYFILNIYTNYMLKEIESINGIINQISKRFFEPQYCGTEYSAAKALLMQLDSIIQFDIYNYFHNKLILKHIY